MRPQSRCPEFQSSLGLVGVRGGTLEDSGPSHPNLSDRGWGSHGLKSPPLLDRFRLPTLQIAEAQ